MLGKLWHKERQRIQTILESVVEVLQKYNRRDLDAEAALERIIDSAIESYSGVQEVNRVSQLESLKAEVVTAQHGINPYTLEKVTLGRRQMKGTVAFRVLQSLQSMLSQEMTAIDSKLQDAEDMVQQILLSALQSGVVTLKELEDADSQNAVEAIWKVVEKDGTLLVAKKKVILSVGVYDGIILCDKVIAGLRS